MIVGLAAYLLQDWYTLQQTMSGIILGLVILWYFMPESPRWLLSKSNKYQEAIKVLTNGAKYNRRPLPEGFLRYDDGTFRVSTMYVHTGAKYAISVLFPSKYRIQFAMFDDLTERTIPHFFPVKTSDSIKKISIPSI